MISGAEISQAITAEQSQVDFSEVVQDKQPHEQVERFSCAASRQDIPEFTSYQSHQVRFVLTNSAGRLTVSLPVAVKAKEKEILGLNRQLSKIDFAVLDARRSLGMTIIVPEHPIKIPLSWVPQNQRTDQDKKESSRTIRAITIEHAGRDEQISFRKTLVTLQLQEKFRGDSIPGKVLDYKSVLKFGQIGTIADPVVGYSFSNEFKELGFRSVKIQMINNYGEERPVEVNCLRNAHFAVPLYNPPTSAWNSHAQEMAILKGLRNLPADYWRKHMEVIFLNRLVSKISEILPETPEDPGQQTSNDATARHHEGSHDIWGQCYDGPREPNGTLPVGHFAIFTCKSTGSGQQFYIVDSPFYGIALRIYKDFDDAISYCAGGESRRDVRDKCLARIIHDPAQKWRLILKNKIKELFI